jgi:hypothetical protein
MMENNLIWKKLLLAGMALFAFATLPGKAVAQTWQKQGGLVVPVVVLGAACDVTKDSIGLAPDRSQLLSCQSGVWKKQSATPTLDSFVGKETLIGFIGNPSYGGIAMRGDSYIFMRTTPQVGQYYYYYRRFRLSKPAGSYVLEYSQANPYTGSFDTWTVLSPYPGNDITFYAPGISGYSPTPTATVSVAGVSVGYAYQSYQGDYQTAHVLFPWNL